MIGAMEYSASDLRFLYCLLLKKSVFAVFVAFL